jgi:hypothetical protein
MCFGNNTTTDTKTTNAPIPDWLRSASQDNLGNLSKLTTNGYQAYQGPMVAGTNGDQDQAYSLTRALAGSSNPYSTTSADAFSHAATAGPQSVSTSRAVDDVAGANGSTAGGSTQDYMNPYVGAVLDPQLRDIDRQTALNQNKINSAATMSGAFGDARTGFQGAQEDKNAMLARSDTIGKAYKDAYDNAMALKEGDINRNLSTDQTNAALKEQGLSRAITGGQALTGLDQYNTGRAADLINLLTQAGNAQQQTAQNTDTANYNEFLRGQINPKDAFSLLTSAINGTPYDKTQTTTEQKPDNSGFGLLGSLGGTLLSAALAPATGGASLIATPALLGGMSKSTSPNPGSMSTTSFG